MIRKIYLTVLFGAVSSIAFGQSPVEITGEIINKVTDEPVPFVHVINKSTNKGTASNTQGRFWINMQPGDTIMFSAIGYKTYSFVLKQEVITRKLIVRVELDEATRELEPVKIFAFRNEQALKRAIIEMDVPINEDNGVEIKGLDKVELTAPGMGISPLTAFANLFSKEEKEKKKLEEYQLEYNNTKLVREKYNSLIVKEVTGLPEDKVEEFMTFCNLDNSFILRSSQYELAVVIQQCLTDFEKLDH